MKLEDLYRDVSGFVRDTILGKKPEGEGKHRPGLLFEENNMMVKEVEILAIDLPDEEIKEGLEEVNRQTVATNLREISRQVELTAKRNEEATEVELAKMQEMAIVRQSALRIKELMAKFEVQQKSLENDWQIRLKNLTDDANASLQRAKDSLNVASIETEYKAKLAEAELKIAEAKQQLDLEKQQELMAIEKELTTVIAGADVERLKAVQPGLIEAIKSLGNSQLAQALAENLPKAGGGLDRLLGVGGMATLKQMVAGTPMGKALEDLGKKDADK